jgi:hypothetical protein
MVFRAVTVQSGGSRATRKPAAHKPERRFWFKLQISRAVMFTTFCVHRQSAAIGVLVSFLGLGVLGLSDTPV